MIISHKYRFIFLKTSKTAGTSVEIALSRFCGPDDIITPISSDDEETRRALGGWGPQNYSAPVWRHSPTDLWKHLTKKKPLLYYYNHMPARKIKNRIDPEVWNNYYKFCIERNPWDRVISQYYWRQRHLENNSMPCVSDFLESNDVRSLKRKGYRLYTIRNQVAVDRICRYESLEQDLEEVRQHLGIPDQLQLPKAKSGIRKDKRHYSQALNQAERNRIADLFSEEINLMGYRFIDHS